MIDEGLLHGMQLATRLGQTLDGRYLTHAERHGQREAREVTPPLDEHRAGAALAVIATLLRAGKIEVLAKRIEQGRA